MEQHKDCIGGSNENGVQNQQAYTSSQHLPEVQAHAVPSHESAPSYMELISNILMSRKEKVHQVPQSAESIHRETIRLIDNYDNRAQQCKKYNELKIHRKYETLIMSLREQIYRLQTIINTFNEFKGKNWLKSILDKLVCYKSQNDSLKKQIQNLKIKQSQFKCKNIQNDYNTKNNCQYSEQLLTYLKKNQFKFGESGHRSVISQFTKLYEGHLNQWNFQMFLHKLDAYLIKDKERRAFCLERNKLFQDHKLKSKIDYNSSQCRQLSNISKMVNTRTNRVKMQPLKHSRIRKRSNKPSQLNSEIENSLLLSKHKEQFTTDNRVQMEQNS